MSETTPPPVPTPDPGDLDIANQSLADAMQVSFRVLRAVMVLLVAVFGFSGFYNVQEGQVAIQLRFGAVHGEPGHQIRGPGGPYFAFPAPIDRVVFVPTTERQLHLDRAFWFTVAAKDRIKKLDQLPVPEGGLVPGRDGSLLTADQNIVHGQWVVGFRVKADGALDYARAVGTVARAEEMVRYAAEQGIVRTVAHTTADRFLASDVDLVAARRAIQSTLDELRSGITIVQVLLQQPAPPLAVRAAFAEVNRAESEKAQKIEWARQFRSMTLNEVAGAAHMPLLDAIDAYELTRRGTDAERIEAADQRIAALLAGDTVGGKISSLISEATGYRTQVVETVRSEAEYFKRLLPQYQQNPRIMRELLWQETLREIMTGDVEAFYLPSDAKSLYLELNRDPRVKLARERKRFEAQVDAQRRGGAR